MRRTFLLAMLAVLGFTVSAQAAEPTRLELTLRDHKFVPTELRAPAGVPIEITLKNEDPTAEEFESKDLHREKIIPGGGTIRLPMGPLKPGNYTFFGEFNPKTAHGNLIAK